MALSSPNELDYFLVGEPVRVLGGQSSTLELDYFLIGEPLPGLAPSGASAPANTVAPAVSGTQTVGSTLTTTDGTWTGAPAPTFTYQWQRGGVNIAAATANTYVLVNADDATNVRCVVTATNASGSASANSNAVAILEPKPTNSVAPVASGTVHVGDTISTTTGTWANQGGTIATYQYQWQDCATSGGTYADIVAATSATYSIAIGELGLYLRCNVKATNSGGQSVSATATNVLGPVVAAVASTSFGAGIVALAEVLDW